MQGLPFKGFQGRARHRPQPACLGPEPCTVGGIAQYGVPDMGEMDPDLVRAACFQRECEKTCDQLSIRSGEALENLPVRDCGPPTFAYGLLVAGMRMPADRCLYRALRAIRCAPDKSEIAALQRSLGFFRELPGERAVRLVGLGNHHQASGVLVEAVDDAWTLDAPDTRQAGAAVGDQCIDQCA